MVLFFADTYALIDYFKGNKNYKKYFEENEIITTKFNLMELYYSALKETSEWLANLYFDSLLTNCVKVNDELLKKAMKFKLKEKKKHLSYVDAIGYQIALSKKVKFLTGDKEFKKMKNVEFVK